MRIFLALIFFSSIALTSIRAQEGTTTPLDELRPDESSPFFTDQQLAKYYTTAGGQAALQENMVDRYPNTGGTDSAPVMLKRFFKGMFGSVQIGSPSGKAMSSLKIDPASFSVADRGEITVKFRIENTKNRLLKLDFPTSQRVEILLRDASGAILETWSSNQVFDPQEGVLMINPDEHVEYSESLSTRHMKAGETYLIEASLANNPEFNQSLSITPN